MRRPSSMFLFALALGLTAGVAQADIPRRPAATTTTPAPDAPVTEAPAPPEAPPPESVEPETVPPETVPPQTAAPDPVPTETRYIAPAVEDDEAVIVSLSMGSTTFTNPLVGIVDHTGAELDCVLPCTLRTRAGHLSFRGERLDAGVDLDPAGLTYDVTLTQGSNGEDVGIGVALALTGGAVLGLSIWAFLTPELEEGVFGLAVLGAIYGGLAFLLGTPYAIALLANLNGGATMTGYRVGLSSRVEFTGDRLRVSF